MVTSSIFEATRLGLARITLESAGELRRALERSTSASAQALMVARVGVWFFTPDGAEMVCASVYDLAKDVHDDTDCTIALSPTYVAALETKRVLAIDDVRAAPETLSQRERHFDPLGVTSVMDAPVFRLGEIVAVLRHEHIGPRREWNARERDFAASVADLLAVMLEQATRLDVEAALTAQRERLAKAEKLEALSRLSGGVAHDFNNVLASMLLAITVIQRERRTDADLVAQLGKIAEVGERGTRIVRQLLAFCREGPYHPRPIDLTRAVSESRSLLTSLISGGSTLRMSVPEERLVVSIDPAKLDQIVMNLVINARDAMPSGGEIQVTLSAADTWVTLGVRDQGVGIEENARDKIFEPFFTTKGEGTGLGLATVQSLVEQAGGTISLESALGKGSTFSVRLPRVG